MRPFLKMLANTDFGQALIGLCRDESGLATVEYCTAGGVLSGAILLGAHALWAAQEAAVARMIAPGA